MTEAVSISPLGRIDVHSHLLPGVDDGCRSLDESIACIERLREAGYVGTVCTPHVIPRLFAENTPTIIRQRVAKLQSDLKSAGVDYAVWPGGELQLFEGAIEWMQGQGVPTMADSRCVLTDTWCESWPRWATDIYRWLLERGYQPILAHPERLPFAGDASFDKVMRELEAMGVWLQGNFRCMTGEEGYHADLVVRKLLSEGRYRLMALDMHGPESLRGRLDGLALVEAEFGREVADAMTIDAPRRCVLPHLQRASTPPGEMEACRTRSTD